MSDLEKAKKNEPVIVFKENASLSATPTCAKSLNSPEPAGLLFENLEWLTTEQAATYLGLSVGSLRNMTSTGEIPYYKLGKRNRYRLSELRNLLLATKRGGGNAAN